jgi:hypothetical protein
VFTRNVTEERTVVLLAMNSVDDLTPDSLGFAGLVYEQVLVSFMHCIIIFSKCCC